MMWNFNLATIEFSHVAPALVVWAAVVLERWLPINQRIHPVELFSLVCRRLAAKVNYPNRSSQQQATAGILAFLILILPTLALIAAFKWLILFPYMLDAFIIYFCLSWQPVKESAKAIESACVADQSAVAKELTQSIVLRDAASLSILGIRKATSESLILRTVPQFIGVIFWYLIGGGLAAIGYRLLTVCSQNWNVKRPDFQHFGLLPALIRRAMDIIPNVIFGLFLWSFGWTHKIKPATKPTFNYDRQYAYILAKASSASQIRLGGPVIYQDTKIRRPVFNQAAPQPDAMTIPHSLKLIQYCQHAFLTSMTLGFVAWWVLVILTTPK